MGNGPPRPQNHDIGSGIPAILVLSSHSPRCQFRPAIRHQASHLTSACTWTSTVNKRTDGFAAHLSVSAGQAWNNFPPKIYVSILHVTSCSHVHWKARATHLLLSCVRAGVLGSGVGKGAKTKQPTITTARQWSQQRLSMQSHKEGSKSLSVQLDS